MAITFKGQPTQIIGRLPAKDDQAPDFQLTNKHLTEINRKEFINQILILSIFPSIDTSVCAATTQKFNQYISELRDVTLLAVSVDTPFALNRFCSQENLNNIVPASSFRHPEFGEAYGVTILEGPLKGFLSRAVVVIDKDNRVLYSEQVPEITQEPNYDKILEAVK